MPRRRFVSDPGSFAPNDLKLMRAAFYCALSSSLTRIEPTASTS